MRGAWNSLIQDEHNKDTYERLSPESKKIIKEALEDIVKLLKVKKDGERGMKSIVRNKTTGNVFNPNEIKPYKIEVK